MSTLEERALADSDDSDRFVTSERGYGDAIDSFVAQTSALVRMTAERDAALATIAKVARLCDVATALAATKLVSSETEDAIVAFATDIRAALEGTP